MLPPLDLHFHLLAACWNSTGVGLNWPMAPDQDCILGSKAAEM